MPESDIMNLQQAIVPATDKNKGFMRSDGKVIRLTRLVDFLNHAKVGEKEKYHRILIQHVGYLLDDGIWLYESAFKPKSEKAGIDARRYAKTHTIAPVKPEDTEEPPGMYFWKCKSCGAYNAYMENRYGKCEKEQTGGVAG